MKQILLIVFIILLVGCSQEAVQEPLQQLENSIEKQPEDEFKHAYSVKKVRISPLNNLGKDKTIEQLIEEQSYMKKVYDEIYELHNEQQLIEFIEQKLLEKDYIIGVRYLGQEMPAKLIEDTYERITNENDLINGTFEDFEYGIEQITNGYFIDLRNVFIINQYHETRANKEIEEMYASLEPQLVGLTDYEKIKKIYEFVMDQMDYIVGGTYIDHSVVGFVKGRGVCQAYAIGLYTLLTKAGFEARYVDGPLNSMYQNGFAGHAWNMVKLDEQWYHLDATWDDELRGDWRYFLVSDTRVNGSRGWKKEFYEPAPSNYVHP